MLLSMHSYWAQAFVIPKHVMHEIERICRAFLWSGDLYNNKPSYVKWSKVCTPKAAGDLGVRNIHLWNITALGKYVWAVEKKLDNLWVKWVHNVYIKQDTWWDYVPKSNCSWYWKQLCSIKEEFKVFFTAAQLQQI